MLEGAVHLPAVEFLNVGLESGEFGIGPFKETVRTPQQHRRAVGIVDVWGGLYAGVRERVPRARLRRCG